jgi:hypothetical protein
LQALQLIYVIATMMALSCRKRAKQLLRLSEDGCNDVEASKGVDGVAINHNLLLIQSKLPRLKQSFQTIQKLANKSVFKSGMAASLLFAAIPNCAI